jgi:cytochrome P450
MGATILDMDNEDHARIRAVLAPQFTLSAVEQFREEIIEPIVCELLDEALEKGDVDFIADFAIPLPLRVTAKVLGVPAGDCAWVHNQLRPILQFLDDSHHGLEQAVSARGALLDYLENLVRCCEENPDKSLLTYLVGVHRTKGTLTHSEVLQAGLLMLAAATETTIGAIANTLLALCVHPGAWDSIRADASLSERMVHETLRWEPPLHATVRFAARNLRFEGALIRKATPVILMLGSANRDEAHFTSPDTWNPHRVEREVLSFGFGRHLCLGFNFAQRELAVVVRAISRRLLGLSIEGNDRPKIVGRLFKRPASLRLRLDGFGVHSTSDSMKTEKP